MEPQSEKQDGKAPALDPTSSAAFRAALGRVPTSVAIVTGVHDGTPVGVAVGSFSSVSLDPPLVGFFIAEASRSWPLIEPSGSFCVSVLGDDQEAISRLFATSGADKFAGCSWRTTTNGQPLIDGAHAWFECDVEDVTAAGDHRLVLGRVRAMEVNPGRSAPLLFLGGVYGGFVATTTAAADDGWA